MPYSRKPVNARIEEKLKFYSHYHWFLAVNGLLIFMSFRNGSGFGWLPLFVIWGTIIAFHFLKVFRPDLVDSWEDDDRRKFLDAPAAEDDFPLRPLKDLRARRWRDNDLV